MSEIRHSGVPRPAKELKGFAEVNLKPSESKRVSVKLDAGPFSHFDLNNTDGTLSLETSKSACSTQNKVS